MKTNTFIPCVICTAALVLGSNVAVVASTPQRGVEIVGKALCKSETGKDGTAVRIRSIVVSTAKDRDGKDLGKLKGKSLLVTGPNASDLEKVDGKQVLALGDYLEERMSLELESVKPTPRTQYMPVT